MTRPSWIRDTRWDRALLALIACSVAMASGLAWKLHAVSMGVGVRPLSEWQPATAIPAIEVLDASGTAVRLETSGRSKPLVLYVFSPESEWCHRNHANFQALERQASGRFDIVAVALSKAGSSRYANEHQTRSPIYTDPSRATSDALRLGPAPALLVIDRKGRLAATWLGVWSAHARGEVEDYFGVRLPR